MAAKSYKVFDRRGTDSYRSNNQLFEASKRSQSRPIVPSLNSDTKDNLTKYGWQELLSASRLIYANFSPASQAIKQIANFTIGNAYTPKHSATDKEYAGVVDAKLFEWHKVFDIRGDPYYWSANLRNWICAILRDGDVGILLTESEEGFPLVQTIPAHRIKCVNEKERVEGGEYDGAAICNGVILSDYGRPIAYRVYSSDDKSFVDYSSSDMMLWFDPEWSDQIRGIPRLASAIPDCQDIRQIRDYIKLALKAESSIAVVETNEAGEADAGAAFVNSGLSGGPSVLGAELYYENFEGGMTRYFKAGTGSKVEFPGGNRPAQNTREFIEKLYRDCFTALGWPIELSYDARTIGGAAIRMVMEVAGKTVQKNQEIACKIAMRIDAWAIAKFTKLGLLPASDEWWKIAHQLPGEITADKGWQSAIDQDEYKIGFTSLADICSRRGTDWKEIRSQTEHEVDDLLYRAEQLVARHPSLSLDGAIALMQTKTESAIAQIAQIEANTNATPSNS